MPRTSEGSSPSSFRSHPGRVPAASWSASAGTLRTRVQGVRRIKLDRRVGDDPYLVGEFVEVPEIVEETKELEALTRNVQNLFGRIIAAVPYLPEELQLAAANVDEPSAL